MEDDALLEEAKRRNNLTSLATSSLLNLLVTIAVQQETKARQCLMHQSQAEASMMAAEGHHPVSNKSDNDSPPQPQSSLSEGEVASMHQSQTEAILNAAELHLLRCIQSDS